MGDLVGFEFCGVTFLDRRSKDPVVAKGSMVCLDWLRLKMFFSCYVLLAWF